MTVIGISGTRSLNDDRAAAVTAVIETLPKDATVVTGGCVGVDAHVARVAYGLGLHVVTILPADRKAVDPDWRRFCHEYEEMLPGSTYRDRNRRIVQRSDQLLAFPLYPEKDARSTRSGTWQTVRIARNMGREITLAHLGTVR
jgi:predicted Rossmann-fold nucleotide-binding protein